ncbi:DUF3397 domain-containing protein [Bacillus sp. Marseille-Q3570]|uniref:DUF3397 domain-containing protein n=1 Tax=Bacillus sp. Marseille-Q3570 TaxID=2963522 RepID=UPI0021B78F5E|nr:DUF3397 domain-containing protein [Bacillus sp. Marseille-Q3570]
MIDFLLGSLGILVTVPLLAWIMVYWITRKITRQQKRSFMVATDVTTFFLIISVMVILYTIWENTFLWPIVILILLIVISITVLYWKRDEDIGLSKIMKTAWRLNFLLFSSGYLVLCLYGLVIRVMALN